MFNIIKKADILLFVVLIFFGTSITLLSISLQAPGKTAEISVNGKHYASYPLDKDATYIIKQNNHFNKITIKNGMVQMSDSDCKNKLCLKKHPINMTNQSIICLPNKVVIDIKGGDSIYDSIAE